MNGYYAIRNLNCNKHFFEWNGVDTFATEEELHQAISEWKKQVTPHTAETVVFEVKHDAE